MTWEENKHSGKRQKYFSKFSRQWLCKDCFSKFIEINQNLKYEEEISHQTFMDSKASTIKFYKTKKENPIFINEEGVTKIGEFRLVVDKFYKNEEDRKIKTIMKFGGTFIDVTAIHLKTGKSVKTTLTFD